jgi:hypothetical protein
MVASQKQTHLTFRKFGSLVFSFGLIPVIFLMNCSSGSGDADEMEVAGTRQFLFTDISEISNLDFSHEPCVDGSYYMPESIGSGCAFFDFDNDGALDIYVLNGAWRHDQSKVRPVVRNRLYHQTKNGKFEDVTDFSGLGDPGYGMGVAVGDIDNDGYLDIYVSNAGPDQFYLNQRNGHFENITVSAGIDNPLWSASAAFLDFDRDGYLDIYVANYVDYNPSRPCIDTAGREDYCGPDGFPGLADKLYKNNGDRTFTDVSEASRIAILKSKGLGVACADFDNDSYTDIYVTNDGEPNTLWINLTDGTFEDRAMALGSALNDVGHAEAGMGIAIGDFDNDLDFDLFMTHLRAETNTLYRHAGDAGFFDDTFLTGLANSSRDFTGFGTGFFDLNNDGWLDLAAVNGRVTRGPRLVKSQSSGYWDDYAEPNLLYVNSGSGDFKDISRVAGSFCGNVENSRGLAFGDIDNDGDIDLLLSNEGGLARLFRNDVQNQGNWLTLRAFDPALKRDAYGAKIVVESATKKLLRLVNPGYSFLSSSDPRVHFGLGDDKTVEAITAIWPDGTSETYECPGVNRFMVLDKGFGRPVDLRAAHKANLADKLWVRTERR